MEKRKTSLMQEEEQLCQKDVLGSHHPISLNNTIFSAHSAFWNKGMSGTSSILKLEDLECA